VFLVVYEFLNYAIGLSMFVPIQKNTAIMTA